LFEEVNELNVRIRRVLCSVVVWSLFGFEQSVAVVGCY